MRNLLLLFAVALGAGLLSSCNHTKTSPLNYDPGTIKRAYAVIRPVEGKQGPSGEAWLMHEKRHLRLVVKLQGLEANSTHGIQLDSLGGCQGGNADGVYNPQGHFHAGPASLIRRVGNMGNLVADGDGKAEFRISLDNATINGKEHAILGRSITINANMDDLKSDPSGGLGDVIACGVIGIMPPEPKVETVWYTEVNKPREELVPESLMWYVPEKQGEAEEAPAAE
jgi:Cu-Zn family superoxide dismutase